MGPNEAPTNTTHTNPPATHTRRHAPYSCKRRGAMPSRNRRHPRRHRNPESSAPKGTSPFPLRVALVSTQKGVTAKKRVDDAGLTTLALPKDHFSLRRPPVFFACPYCRLNIYSPLQDQNSLQVTLACLEASPLKMSQYGCIAFHRSISEKELKFALDRSHSRVFHFLD